MGARLTPKPNRCLCVATGSYQFSVRESELVSTVVAKIRAVDPDEGPNAELDYRILDGDGLGTFSITTDSHTQEGLITLHKVPVSTEELEQDQCNQPARYT